MTHAGFSPEGIARAFHERYERLAPEHSYEARKAGAVPWERVPEDNKDLMRAVVRRLIEEGVILPGAAHVLPGQGESCF